MIRKPVRKPVTCNKKKFKYLVIGGNPISGYNSATTFASLSLVGQANDLIEVKSIVDSLFDQCGGLLLVIDSETGEEV